MSDWKNSLQKTRYVMDSLFLVSFIFVSAPQATGILLHEWLSLFFIIPFAIHLLLHWEWIKQSGSRFFSKTSAKERFSIVWDSLIYLMMLLVFVSGFLVSVVLLAAINIDIKVQDFWSKIHHDSATLLMPMLGVHIALNWHFIVKLSKRMLKNKVS